MASLLLGLSLVVLIINGFLVVYAIGIWASGGPGALLLTFAYTVLVGLGLSSVSFFVCLLSGASRETVIWFDAVLTAALFVTSARLRHGRQKLSSDSTIEPGSSACQGQGMLVRWLRVALACLFGLRFVSEMTFVLFDSLSGIPHGGWDAYAFWNTRARMLVLAEDWGDAFSPLLSHSDYPPLLPFLVARSWAYLGFVTPLAPIAIQALVLVGTVMLVTGAVRRWRGPSYGYLAGTAILLPPLYTLLFTRQYADNLLAFFIAGTVVAVISAERSCDLRTRAGALFVAGLSIGCAAFTKNEGILFLLVAVFAHFLLSLKELRRIGFAGLRTTEGLFLLGIGLLAVPLLVFKTGIAPPNDLLSPKRPMSSFFEQLRDSSRYAVILKLFLAFAFTWDYWGWLIVVLLCFGTASLVRPRELPREVLF